MRRPRTRPACAPSGATAAGSLPSRAVMARTTLTRLEVSSRTPEGSRAARRMRRDGPRSRRALRRQRRADELRGRGARAAHRAVGARRRARGVDRRRAADAGGAQGRPAPPGARRHDARRPRPRAPRPGDPGDRRRRAASAPRTRRACATAASSSTSPTPCSVEALPTAIPESISHDVSAMAIGDTLLLSALSAPEGVTLLGDLDEIVIATLTPPRLRLEERTGDRAGDRAGRRGRGRRRRRGRRRGEAGRRGAGRRAASSTLRLSRGPSIDWLVVGLGNPGREYAGHAAQHRLRGGRRARRPLGARPRARDRYRGRLREGRAGTRRTARGAARAADAT